MNDYYYRREIRLELQAIISRACGFSAGTNFKKGVPLSELITYKHSKSGLSQDRLFQLYVSSIEEIIEGVRLYLPCIDLNGITLEWTAKEIVDKAMDMYYNHVIPCKLSDQNNC